MYHFFSFIIEVLLWTTMKILNWTNFQLSSEWLQNSSCNYKSVTVLDCTLTSTTLDSPWNKHLRLEAHDTDVTAILWKTQDLFITYTTLCTPDCNMNNTSRCTTVLQHIFSTTLVLIREWDVFQVNILHLA